MNKVLCLNTNTYKEFTPGTTLFDMANAFGVNKPYPALGALVNNKLKELAFEVYKPKTVRFIDVTHPDGMRIYQRSLSFVLLKAVNEVFPKVKVKIEHSVSKGLYCELQGNGDVVSIDAAINIANRMRGIIEKNIPFKRIEMETEKAIEKFEEAGLSEKANLFKSRPNAYTSVYYLNDFLNYFYGVLAPSTAYLKTFDLVKYYDGMLLRFPKSEQPDELQDLVLQDKMFDIFREFRQWNNILEASTIGQINKYIKQNRVGELIKVSEALHEKKVAQIADQISQRQKTKMVLISGPSSSGKTTFSNRLAIQLKVAGLKPVTISLDNYFVDREHTPRDENGEYDFEALDALDIAFFNENLLDLFAGKQVELPKFSFETGKRFFDGDTLQIGSDHILIVEGIHALNPELTKQIDNDTKFKIYVSALTTLSMDGHNRIPTTDTRLIRRIIRDYRYRNYSAIETISRWPSVRRGEEKHIFPYQEEADIMFNSAMLHEPGILKRYVDPLLQEIYPNVPEYAEAQRLLKFTSYLTPIPDDEVPFTSIIREFIGGSSFKY